MGESLAAFCTTCPQPRFVAVGRGHQLERCSVDRTRGAMRRSAFAARKPARAVAPRMSQDDPAASTGVSSGAEESWASKYKAFLARRGEEVCKMAMHGYEKLGRGAVFVTDDEGKDGMGIGMGSVAELAYEAKLGDKAKGIKSSTPSVYVPLDKLLAENRGREEQLDPICSRMRDYDPDRQFVCVFETGGVQGADIVTPKRMPDIPPAPLSV